MRRVRCRSPRCRCPLLVARCWLPVVAPRVRRAHFSPLRSAARRGASLGLESASVTGKVSTKIGLGRVLLHRRVVKIAKGGDAAGKPWRNFSRVDNDPLSSPPLNDTREKEGFTSGSTRSTKFLARVFSLSIRSPTPHRHPHL